MAIVFDVSSERQWRSKSIEIANYKWTLENFYIAFYVGNTEKNTNDITNKAWANWTHILKYQKYASKKTIQRLSKVPYIDIYGYQWIYLFSWCFPFWKQSNVANIKQIISH